MRTQRMLAVLTGLAIVATAAGLAIRAAVSHRVPPTQEPDVAHRETRGPAADEASPPAEPVKLIFIHHSCGEHWLSDDDGGLGIALRDNNIFVSDVNYDWGPDDIGDRTDIGHWWLWFRGPSSATYLNALYQEYGQHSAYTRLMSDPGGENEVIVFKSCYPNSHLAGNPYDPPTRGDNPLRGQDARSEHHSVANAKGIYNDLLAYFATRQDKLFIAVTAPPLRARETDAAHAANARAFNDWLVEDWLDGYAHNNVAVFDSYNVLTSNGGNRNRNDVGEETGNHHRWWSGAVQHLQTVSNNTSAYWGGSGGGSHPTAAGNQKATAEFVPLLNVFYNRWRGGNGTLTPTAMVTPTATCATPTCTATSTATATGAPPASTATATATPTSTGTPPTDRQVMVFQNGVGPDASYGGATDATISTWGDNRHANLGGLDYLQVGETGEAEEFRLLVRFELDDWLPADVEVDEARLELRGYDGEHGDGLLHVAAHELTEAWVEGDGRDLKADGRGEGVSWSTARPGTNWSTAGGDFDPAELDRVRVARDADGWYRWDVTLAVRTWVGGRASNYGLLLMASDGAGVFHQFRSSEYDVVDLHPRLVVIYTAEGVATATATGTPTAAPTSAPMRAPSDWVRVPVVLKAWSIPVASPAPSPTPSNTPGPTLTPTPTATTVAVSALIQAADLTYQGAFAYPRGDGWARSGHALTYYPAGDPASDDGYPGSLYAAGHTRHDLVGEMTIPEPVISDSFSDLPTASVLRALVDMTGGRKDNCTYVPMCEYREVDGLAYLPNVDKIAWNLRDWYNVAGYDQDSLGWSDPDMAGARGVWHIGERPSEDDAFHNARTCNYLFTAPERFADEALDEKRLIAGNHREAGALGGSQGPTMYAVAPWEDGDPPSSGQNLDALALLYYPEVTECVWRATGDINEHPDPGMCHFPGYRAMDDWGGGAWVETADRSAILIVGRKGLGDNCYGSQVRCGGDPCVSSAGYHAYPYEPQFLFYDPEALREVATGSRKPWEVLPYAVYAVEEVLDRECAVLGAAAHDSDGGLIYVTERDAGPSGETAVHVWRVD